ncbi:OmpA family protein [Maribacter sp. 2308TA10-17]|uniref:OmpA family protein n=1 Tax=Maribacter sp. 2308TA10-17 TaxID=3386276 RepID=UPI0039BD3F7D
MKNLSPSTKLILSFLLMLGFTTSANSQILKKLGKKAEKAAERAIERRVEKEAQEKTDEVLDSILEPGKKGKKKKSPIPNDKSPSDKESSDPNSEGNSQKPDVSPTSESSEPKSIKVYSKFDFVPGDKLLFFDDFSNDFIGDFPAKWNTNGGGEVVTVNDLPARWLLMSQGFSTYYIPDVPNLPEEYTIEFDILVDGIDRQTSSTADLKVELSDSNEFRTGNKYVSASIPLCQYTPVGIRIKAKKTGAGSPKNINNTVKADIREAILNSPHISIAVNKERYRLWVNEKKYIDVPRAIVPESQFKALKFNVNSLKDGKESVFISNIKVAEGGLDLRRTLMSEGKVSTNGILFDSGSANIQPQSMGIIRQISQVLQQDASINLKIVGHTDADGGDEINMKLSKARAEAVMNVLISIYNASPERLSAEGMGESTPVGDNNTADGKAQNRRVEFIKQ